MKKLNHILAKQALSLNKHQPTKHLIRYYVKTAKESQNFVLKIKNDLDFFNAAIMIESLNNKILFETTYERERKELTDLWPTLSYQERNKLINLKISEIKKRCRSFKSEKGFTIWIAFFDELFNTLYDKEMNIFDLEQYFSLYKDYAKRMIKLETYGIMPYADAFIDIKPLGSFPNQVIFYYDVLKAIYMIKENQGSLSLKKLSLKRSYQYMQEDRDQMIKVMIYFDEEKHSDVINELINSPFMSDKANKALKALQRKLK